MRCPPVLTPPLLIVLALSAAPSRADEPRRNVFDDPFEQLTDALPAADCPAPPGPLLTEAEARAQAHGRIERGTSCFQSGRCRLPNAYLYDREIMPRVRKAVAADGRFDADTRVWALGQRRWIWLQGCVRTPAQSAALEALVRRIDDVEQVVNELTVVPRLPPPGPTPAPKPASPAAASSARRVR